jgi:hypothetical protein
MDLSLSTYHHVVNGVGGDGEGGDRSSSSPAACQPHGNGFTSPAAMDIDAAAAADIEREADRKRERERELDGSQQSMGSPPKRARPSEAEADDAAAIAELKRMHSRATARATALSAAQ